MKSELFLKPRLTGIRFDGGAIPLELLADFAVLSEMIVEIAKWKYLENNSTRKRVPRGFADDISLKLTGVESGSAILVLTLFTIGNVLFSNSVAHPYLEQARQAVIEAVGAAEHNNKITDHLPQKLLGYFARLGRNLGDGEAMELTNPQSQAHVAVRLTKETRRKLILASSVEEYTEETFAYGLIHEFDQRSRTFQLTLTDCKILSKIPVESQHYDAVLEAYNGYRDKLRVCVYGIGRFDRDSRLQEFEAVEHVTILDPLDIPFRIEELRQLKLGWLDGQGIPPTHDGLDWLSQSFYSSYADDAPLPYLYPTPEGRVLAEWSHKPWSSSLEIDLAKKSGDWHTLNLDTDDEETRVLDLTDPQSWMWLAQEIRRIDAVNA